MAHYGASSDPFAVGIEVAKRRNALCAMPPKCPKCHNEQVQLVSWKWVPAKWKCRMCRYRFIHEPDFAGAVRHLIAGLDNLLASVPPRDVADADAGAAASEQRDQDDDNGQREDNADHP